MDINNLSTRISLSPSGLSELQILYEKALLIGPAVATYLQKLIALGYMELRILDGARALLCLQIAYGNQRLENACKRGLMSPRCNYEVIKTILLNNMDQVAPKKNPPKTDIAIQDTDYLRGPESFNI